MLGTAGPFIDKLNYEAVVVLLVTRPTGRWLPP